MLLQVSECIPCKYDLGSWAKFKEPSKTMPTLEIQQTDSLLNHHPNSKHYPYPSIYNFLTHS